MKEMYKRTLDYQCLSNDISNWIKEYAVNSNIKTLIVGVSGGIDSSVVSTLSANTGLKTILVEMPIHQASDQVSRAKEHINWLKSKYSNIESHEVDLTNTYETLKGDLTSDLSISSDNENSHLVLANMRSRLRMVTLYGFSNANKGLVVGTGNKVEDFGVGFFTVGGDGTVDISPIADLMKSEVYKMGEYLGVNHNILEARPTDGLWGDDRTDEDQIGATYDELEWAMLWVSEHTNVENGGRWYDHGDDDDLTDRQKEVLGIYNHRHNTNKFKMLPIPIFKL